MTRLLPRRPVARERSRRTVVVAVAVIAAAVLAAAALAVGLTTRVEGAQTARHSLRVMPLGTATAGGWTLGARAVLVTDRRSTRMLVDVTRSSGAKRTPGLEGNFDGSGGGEAQQVTCSSDPMSWTVAAGKVQTVALSCDAIVAPAVVRQLLYVYAGERG